MVNVLGGKYYFDVDTITDKCRIGGTESDVNLFKYEIFKSCIERVLDEPDDVDESVWSLEIDKLPVSFKFAFNTLLKYKILIEK